MVPLEISNLKNRSKNRVGFVERKVPDKTLVAKHFRRDYNAWTAMIFFYVENLKDISQSIQN